MPHDSTQKTKDKPKRRYLRVLWECDSVELCSITEESEREKPGAHAEYKEMRDCVSEARRERRRRA